VLCSVADIVIIYITTAKSKYNTVCSLFKQVTGYLDKVNHSRVCKLFDKVIHDILWVPGACNDDVLLFISNAVPRIKYIII